MANLIKVFAGGAGANTLTPGAYAALGALLSQGFQEGTALSVQMNTVYRQSSYMAAGLAQFCFDNGFSPADDGNAVTLEAGIELAITNFIAPIIAAALQAQWPYASIGSYFLFGSTTQFTAGTVYNGSAFAVAGGSAQPGRWRCMSGSGPLLQNLSPPGGSYAQIYSYTFLRIS